MKEKKKWNQVTANIVQRPAILVDIPHVTLYYLILICIYFILLYLDARGCNRRLFSDTMKYDYELSSFFFSLWH